MKYTDMDYGFGYIPSFQLFKAKRFSFDNFFKSNEINSLRRKK